MMRNQPDKYRRLLSALEDTGYSKVVQILEGVLTPVGSCHRNSIRTCAKDMFQQLNTTEVLPHLYAKGVISNDDRQQIQRTERTESNGAAALELLNLLPNRNEQWFKHFIDSLAESGHRDLADSLTTKTMQKITKQQNENKSLCQSTNGRETPCILREHRPSCVFTREEPEKTENRNFENVNASIHTKTTMEQSTCIMAGSQNKNLLAPWISALFDMTFHAILYL